MLGEWLRFAPSQIAYGRLSVGNSSKSTRFGVKLKPFEGSGIIEKVDLTVGRGVRDGVAHGDWYKAVLNEQIEENRERNLGKGNKG